MKMKSNVRKIHLLNGNLLICLLSWTSSRVILKEIKIRFLGIDGRISESWDECERHVRDFFSNTLGLTDLAIAEIERAHIVGSTRSDSCPIIAKFTKCKDRESVLRAARQNLSSKSQYSVREDYTERV